MMLLPHVLALPLRCGAADAAHKSHSPGSVGSAVALRNGAATLAASRQQYK